MGAKCPTDNSESFYYAPKMLRFVKKFSNICIFTLQLHYFAEIVIGCHRHQPQTGSLQEFDMLWLEDVLSLPLQLRHGIALLIVHVPHCRWTLFTLILKPNCFRSLLKRDLLMYHALEVTLLMSRNEHV